MPMRKGELVYFNAMATASSNLLVVQFAVATHPPLLAAYTVWLGSSESAADRPQSCEKAPASVYLDKIDSYTMPPSF